MTGACRCEEILNMKVTDIEDLGALLLVKIPSSKMNKARSFTITEERFISLYRKYLALRPDDFDSSRFFIKYQNGKCHRTVIGIHKIANVPKEVAHFLKLDEPNKYTGHSLRSTSAIILEETGGDITCLRNTKRRKLSTKVIITPPDSDNDVEHIKIEHKTVNIETTKGDMGLNMQNCTFNNCTINFHINNAPSTEQ